jgi:starvation-inducible DNA-binding protein
MQMDKETDLQRQPQQVADLAHTDIDAEGVKEISHVLRQLLADVFTLYVKTKNFHWHMTGPHFRDYHLLLDEQS